MCVATAKRIDMVQNLVNIRTGSMLQGLGVGAPLHD